MPSALGLAAVYNMLPEGTTFAPNAAAFQSRLQLELKLRAELGLTYWHKTYPLRQADGSRALIARELDGFLNSSSGDDW